MWWKKREYLGSVGWAHCIIQWKEARKQHLLWILNMRADLLRKERRKGGREKEGRKKERRDGGRPGRDWRRRRMKKTEKRWRKTNKTCGKIYPPAIYWKMTSYLGSSFACAYLAHNYIWKGIKNSDIIQK